MEERFLVYQNGPLTCSQDRPRARLHHADMKRSRGQAEEARTSASGVVHGRHLLVRGRRVKRAAASSTRGSSARSARGVEEDVGAAQHPVGPPIDVLLPLERLVPRGVAPVGGGPGPARDALMVWTATLRSRQIA